MIGYDDIQAASRRLDGVAHRTPVITSRTLDQRAGARVMLKAEALQRAGSFKFRGAYNKIASIAPADRAPILFTFRWLDDGRWEGNDYKVDVRAG